MVAEIGTKVRKIRELKNFTQEYMADKLGISQSAYAKIEKEDSDITISRLQKLAEIFEIKLDDLLNFNEKYVFNNFGSAHDKSFSVNQISDNERELYNKNIKLLEEKIQYQQEIIASLRG